MLNKKNIIEKIKQPNNIKNNLNLDYVLDTFVKDENFYISFVETKNGCETMNVSKAKINNDYLEFEKILDSNECGITIQGGRIQNINILDKKGILLTTGANIPDLPSHSAQNNESIFGKILFIDTKSGELKIFSKGHRNPQGLLVIDDLVLSTEHGPKGGDEINKIILGKNYGWPISSYGESYANDDLKYHKSHIENNFEEPIFSFVPSIGISEIISLPNSFNTNWQNNFLISSLNGKSLYRIKFNNSFSKIFYIEKIFIGQRIRDLKYDSSLNIILLSLEDNGELGIIKSN
jgi:glucose/arabinose dehydrogenase